MNPKQPFFIEWLWLEETSKDIIHSSCYGQGHLSLGQVAQSSIQPAVEHSQYWSIYNFPGNLFCCLTTLIVQMYFLYPI